MKWEAKMLIKQQVPKCISTIFVINKQRHIILATKYQNYLIELAKINVNLGQIIISLCTDAVTQYVTIIVCINRQLLQITP